MNIKLWVLSTCVPSEGKPYVNVFGSEAEARAEFQEVMRDEWEQMQPEDDSLTRRSRRST